MEASAGASEMIFSLQAKRILYVLLGAIQTRRL